MVSDKHQQYIVTIMTMLLLCSMIFLSREAALYVSSQPHNTNKYTVVIDCGHGGKDPGKIAADGTLEKDINLAIGLKLQKYLEAADISVVMTRTTDIGLYDETAPNKKMQDMKNRIELMEKSEADIVISLHQNSYSSSEIHGAQIFYYTESTRSKLLAETLQQILIDNIDPENHRKAKPNDNYYLLKKTKLPIIIAECGFLSNPSEAALLKSESFQDKLAWVLHLGIIQYLNQYMIKR